MYRIISSAPGFNPVMAGEEDQNRFNGFCCAHKPLKRLIRPRDLTNQLKPGINESCRLVAHSCDLDQ